MATKYIVNNVTGQTINGESVQRPYKVYTALLTQTGGDSILSLSSGDSLTIGVTYTIKGYTANDDFSNVGGPPPVNENDYWSDYSFVATETTPAVWTFTSLDYNTGAPVVTVLENTIGNIWFSYGDVGQYFINFSETFFVKKMYAQGSSYTEDGTGFRVTTINVGGAPTFNNLLITTTYPMSETFANDILNNTPIEIRVYN